MTMLAEYDPTWPARYEETVAELRPAFGDTVEEFEHIGSTAVPGLVAKPVIDIAAKAVSLSAIVVCEPALASLGFLRSVDGPPDRRTYIKLTDDGVLTHNLHVFAAENWDRLNQRILRDYLRANPDACRQYADLKRRLAARGLTGFDYTYAKTNLIQHLTNRARATRSLTPVPVWSKS